MAQHNKPAKRACPSCSRPEPVELAGCRAVRWRGKYYWLRRHERGFVSALFMAAMAGQPCLPAGVMPRSLRQSPAWGSLIVPGQKIGGPRGTVCLAEMPAESNTRA